MRTVSTIARYLAGVIFLVFGLNGLLNFIPLPPPGGIAGQFMPLAVAVLAPVIVNILSFHVLMAPRGLPLALFVALVWALSRADRIDSTPNISS